MACNKKPDNCNCYKNPGSPKKDGSHDHRHNVGPDRTPAQKEGDAKRRKDQRAIAFHDTQAKAL